MVRTSRPNQPQYTIDYLRVGVFVRWNTILMPFEQPKFLSLLPDEGYVLAVAGTSFVEVSGPLARKGEVTLSTDTNRLTLGVEGKDVKALLEEFEGIERLLRLQLSFDSPGHASFHELTALALVWTKRDPLQVFREAKDFSLVASKFSETAGIGAATNASLRLVPLAGEVHGPDWWDIHIEPSFRSPHQCYRVSVVYRNTDKAKVVELASKLEEVILTAIRLLERAHD